nr:MAG TPA: hypothetical protein [Crassvirales sp.]
MLFSISSTSWSQSRLDRLESKVDSLQRSRPFTGGSSERSERVSKEIIKLANAKLILGEEYKVQYETYKQLYELKIHDSYLQDSIISKQQLEIKRITTLGNQAIENLNKESSKSAKYKKQRNYFIASTGVLALFVILLK